MNIFSIFIAIIALFIGVAGLFVSAFQGQVLVSLGVLFMLLAILVEMNAAAKRAKAVQKLLDENIGRMSDRLDFLAISEKRKQPKP